MDIQDITDGLNALGFKDGFAIGGEPAEIIIWTNEAEQPSNKDIEDAVSSGAYARAVTLVEDIRRGQYQQLCDPLFFGFQRGDNTEQEWLDAVQAVKDANPYPESPSA